LAIQEYLEQRNPAAASRVGASIRQAVEILRHFPFAGRPGRASGTREWVVRRYPYIVVGEIGTAEDGITILGIFHSAQRRD